MNGILKFNTAVKYIALLLFTSLFLIGGCNSSTSKSTDYNTTIQGKIDGLKKGKLYLERHIDTLAQVVDSVLFNGTDQFTFQLNLEEPEMVYLYLEKTENTPINDFLAVFLEPGNITIETTLKNFERDARVTGSVNHDKWVEYQELTRRFQDKRLELIKETYQAEMNKNASKVLEINRKNQSLIQSKYMSTVNFAINNSALEIAPYLALYEIFDTHTNYLDTIYNSLTQPVKQSKYGRELENYIIERKNLD